MPSHSFTALLFLFLVVASSSSLVNHVSGNKIVLDGSVEREQQAAQRVRDFFATSAPPASGAGDSVADQQNTSKRTGHTNNWAVLVCTSRFWFNYRHVSNTLGFYHSVKRLGIPDSQIILMLADDMACNPRNNFAAQVFNNQDKRLNLYGDDVEVDYRGYEVTVESLIRVLSGRHSEHTPRSKRLLSDENSNVLVYLTGHGGDEFLKFQDEEEISSSDLADAFAQMHVKRRYHELLFVIDTCQANTLYNRFYSPNILAMGSSRLGENSYSHHADADVGVAVIDRMTYYSLEFMEREHRAVSQGISTLQELFESLTYSKLASHAGWRTDLFERPINQVPISDFYGSDANAIPTQEAYPSR